MIPGFIDFTICGDHRGSLIALEQMKQIPFDIKRVYYIFDTQKNVTRGLHAHRNLEQVAVCVSGSCKLLLDDGTTTHEYQMDSPTKGVYIGNMVWRELYDFSDDCVVLVLASELYDESDYIRDYEEFICASQR